MAETTVTDPVSEDIVSHTPSSGFQPTEFVESGFQGESTESVTVTSSAQVFSRKAAGATSTTYSRGNGKAPANPKASELLGAFFFLYGTFSDKKERWLVAYDPWVKPTDIRESVLQYYHQGSNHLPYYELFAIGDSLGQWKRGMSNYAGVFGRNKAQGSPAWYYEPGSDSPIANGVNVAFWNTNEKQNGLFTNSPASRFDSKAGTPVMNMYEGTKRNFLPEPQEGDFVRSLELDYYAIYNGPLR